jgi:hypothetical protein
MQPNKSFTDSLNINMNSFGTKHGYQTIFRERIAEIMVASLSIRVMFRNFLKRCAQTNSVTRQALRLPFPGQWYLITRHAISASNLRRSWKFSGMHGNEALIMSAGQQQPSNHKKRGTEA